MIEHGGLRFDDRVALVTGAGGGLGRAHAVLLASRGAKVVINDVSTKPHADLPDEIPTQSTLDEILDGGGEAVEDCNSVSSPEGAAAAVQTAIETFGGIDIVVNNAGIVRDSSFPKMSEEELAGVIAVHLGGSFHVTQSAWPHLREKGYGRVVMTTSVAGLFGNFGQANYSSAKAGMVGLARTLAVEGGRHGIRVNAISPAAATQMSSALIPKEVAEKMRPDLVSPMVAYLCHETCEFTGEIFYAAAGRYARNFIGLTKGYRNPDATVDDIAAHIAEITDLEGYKIPKLGL